MRVENVENTQKMLKQAKPKSDTTLASAVHAVVVRLSAKIMIIQ